MSKLSVAVILKKLSTRLVQWIGGKEQWFFFLATYKSGFVAIRFWFWGYVKNLVYAENIRDIQQSEG